MGRFSGRFREGWFSWEGAQEREEFNPSISKGLHVSSQERVNKKGLGESIPDSFKKRGNYAGRGLCGMSGERKRQGRKLWRAGWGGWRALCNSNPTRRS